MKSLALAASLALMFSLTACGGSSDAANDKPAASQPEPGQSESDIQTGGPGNYMAMTTGGGTLKVNLTGDDPKPDQLTQDTKTVQDKAGVTGGQYVTVDVDNTDGTDAVAVFTLSVVTKDGSTLEGTPITDALDEWQDSLSDDDYNLGVDAYNAWSERERVLPGAKSTVLYYLDQPVKAIKAVFIDGEQTGRE